MMSLFHVFHRTFRLYQMRGCVCFANPPLSLGLYLTHSSQSKLTSCSSTSTKHHLLHPKKKCIQPAGKYGRWSDDSVIKGQEVQTWSKTPMVVIAFDKVERLGV